MFTPVLAKHSKSFSLIDYISVGVDRMQRNFEPMRKQVEAWQTSELTARVGAPDTEETVWLLSVCSSLRTPSWCTDCNLGYLQLSFSLLSPRSTSH